MIAPHFRRSNCNLPAVRCKLSAGEALELEFTVRLRGNFDAGLCVTTLLRNDASEDVRSAAPV
jgi:hypothetical protein